MNTGLAGFERDFHWPEFQLAVEIDGAGHTRPRNRLEDVRRDRTLDEAGYTHLRFTEDAVYRTPGEVRATVSASVYR